MDSRSTRALRLALALVFLLAAPQKILDPSLFAQSVAGFLILPNILVNSTALILPWLEIVVAILLLCRVWPGPTLLLANGMLVVFLAALVSALVRGIDVDCGCFSPTGQSDVTEALVRDVLFLAIGLPAALMHRIRPEAD